MDAVPDPPPIERSGRYGDLYAKVRALGVGERNAVKVRFEDQKEFQNVRGRMRKIAERESLRMLSSRSDDYKVGYFWLVKP